MRHTHVHAQRKALALKTVIAANSGAHLSENSWTAAGKRHAELVRQSEALAAKLKEGGIDPYRKDTLPLSVVGLLSGEVKEVTPYRNSNLIPVVQSANQKYALKTLRHYCEDRTYIRMMVITTGEKCTVSEVRERHTKLARKISKWAAHPMCKSRGVEVILARHEMTIDEPLPFVHFHAHVLVDCHKCLGGEDWSAFLSETHEFFGAKILDSGLLRKKEEALKYCLKPAELEKLSPYLLCELYKQLHKQKLCRFLGGLLAFRKQLDKDKLRIGSIRRKIGGRVEWHSCLISREKSGAKYAKKSTTSPTDIVLGVTVPCAIFKPILEPCLVVAEFNGNVDELVKKRDLEKWRTAARNAAPLGAGEAAKAAPSTVHNSAITVPTAASQTLPHKEAAVPSLRPSSPAKTGHSYKLKSTAELSEVAKVRFEKKRKEKKFEPIPGTNASQGKLFS
jgi:hypothetical protein